MQTVTFILTDEKFEDLKAGLLAARPNRERDDDGVLLITDNKWAKRIMKEAIKGVYRAGKVRTASKLAVIDESILD